MERDQLLALMVAEQDAIHRGTDPFRARQLLDAERRNAPAVELVGSDETGLLVAVEHTVIESYEGQIVDYLVAKKMFPFGGPEIEPQAEEEIDAGNFRLHVPAGALAAIPKAGRATAAASIAAWARSAIEGHRSPSSGSPQVCQSGEPPGVGFEVSLVRMPLPFGLHEISAQVVMVEPKPAQDLSSRREERISRALRKKCPKLLSDAGDGRSILVLEDRDLRFSSPCEVARCVQAASGGIQLPDLVVLLDVTGGNPVAWPVYDGGEWTDVRSAFTWTFPAHQCGQLNRMER